MKYKYMVFDIDGTLVKGDMSTVLGPKTKEMFNILHDKGVYLALASGRYIDDLQQYQTKWSLDYPFDCLIGCNGAMMRDELTDTNHYYFQLSLEEIKEIEEKMSKYDILSHIYYPDYTLYNKNDPMVEEARKRHWSKKIIVANTPEEMAVEPCEKIMYFTSYDPVESKEIEDYAHSICEGKDFICMRTRANMIEFGKRDAIKSYCMKKFCEYHNISLEETAAFGDTSNDNDMLVAAGLGVCLINGTDDTKACADIITEKDCLSDGVGYFIEDYLLKNDLV